MIHQHQRQRLPDIISCLMMVTCFLHFRYEAAQAFLPLRRHVVASFSRRLQLRFAHAKTASIPDTAPTATMETADFSRPSFTIYYNDVYEVHLPPNHRFPMKKYRQTRDLLQDWMAQNPILTNSDNEPLIDCELCVSPLATVEELETTHCPKYIQRYTGGNMTQDEQRNVGFPWSEQSVRRSFSSVGGTLAAACTVVERSRASSSNNSKLHWGAHIAGGTHHAFYDRGEGFSVFSDMAVAANVVLQRYTYQIKRVLLIDLDVHQGNGNANMFQNDPRVATFSVHCKSNYFSPKETSDLDIELPASCDDRTYLMTLQHWLKRLGRGEGGQFDLVFYQAGVDVLEEDRLGRMSLTFEGVERRNKMVYDFCRDLELPLVICMGGGYPRGSDWSPILRAHANVYYQAYQYLQTHARESKQKQ